MQTHTRSALVDNATALVRRRGYAAFSYADLAEVVGIRKPSIHHHFPLKEDLAVAIVEAYTGRFRERLNAIAADAADLPGRLRAYAGLYREGLARGEGCLCGVLASEVAILPPRVRAGVEAFFALNLRWLEQAHAAAPEVGPRGVEPRRAARTTLATLQGALFVALSVSDPNAFDDAVEGWLTALAAQRG